MVVWSFWLESHLSLRWNISCCSSMKIDKSPLPFFLVSRQYSNLYSSYVPALFLRHFSEQNPRLHPQNLSIRQELQGIRTVNLPKALLQNLEFLEKSLYRFMGVVCRLWEAEAEAASDSQIDFEHCIAPKRRCRVVFVFGGSNNSSRSPYSLLIVLSLASLVIQEVTEVRNVGIWISCGPARCMWFLYCFIFYCSE